MCRLSAAAFRMPFAAAVSPRCCRKVWRARRRRAATGAPVAFHNARMAVMLLLPQAPAVQCRFARRYVHACMSDTKKHRIH
jgi:hypothetical protein